MNLSQSVVLIHTVPPLIDVFNQLAATLLPGVKLFHILDEPLLEQVRIRGHLAATDTQRLGAHIAEAAAIGAEAVLVTCSTISPCVPDASRHAGLPVFRIDEPMITEAVRIGTRIGVVATNHTTLEPTRALLNDEAQRIAKSIEVELVLVPGALPALLAGDGETHDRLLAPALLELAQRVDVVVLAQASMARILNVLDVVTLPVPVLSSPHLAMQQVNGWLTGALQHQREIRIDQ